MPFEASIGVPSRLARRHWYASRPARRLSERNGSIAEARLIIESPGTRRKVKISGASALLRAESGMAAV